METQSISKEAERARLIAELKAAKRDPEQVAGVKALVGICECRREDFLDDERALYLWDKGVVCGAPEEIV